MNLSEKLNLTLITSLHQISVAKKYCERTVALNRGCVVFDGPTKELTNVVLAKLYGSNKGDLLRNEEFDYFEEVGNLESKLALIQ